MQRRNTPQRKIVLDTVNARCDHPTADDIYNDVIKLNPRISRGTVYRNLHILADSGNIRHIKIPAGADRFDLRLDRHYHIYCVGCGKVADVEIPYSADMDTAAAKESGYEVAVHRTVFEGYCPQCRRNKRFL